MNIKPFYLTAVMLTALALVACKESETVVTPDISIPTSLSILEGNATQNKAIITVTLSEATDREVSLTWSTSDGTAIAGEDYIAVTDSALVFAPGETTKNIGVVIVNDTAFESDETMFVEISNVKNAIVVVNRTLVTITNDDVLNPVIKLAALTKVTEALGMAQVGVTLTPASTKTITVKWSTKDGTAVAGDDYTAVSGASLVFLPGQTSQTIQIPIINDSELEFNDSFFIVVDEITNATYTPAESKVTIMNDDSYTPELADDGYITPDNYPGMKNVWSDEFDGTKLNMDWWSYELGAGGWGNNELQTYTSSSNNSSVGDGKLKIIATNNYGNYYSARLVTKGKKEFTYGRIDIRAKLPYGQGIWPALWMLGSNISQLGWPGCGEIDIMENLGQDVKKVYGTVHYNDGGHKYIGGSYTLQGSQGYNDQFHIFTIIWQENSITWYVDYHQYFEATSSNINYDAFRLPQFFIFNVAIGGNWPGNPNATTVFPQTMTVDYVRVFQPL